MGEGDSQAPFPTTLVVSPFAFSSLSFPSILINTGATVTSGAVPVLNTRPSPGDYSPGQRRGSAARLRR